VPDNLYLIGTMNTADRSIALLDTALRRRFRFEERMPDVQVLRDHGISDIDGVDVPALMTVMNERIEAIYDRDHQIGHAYFLRLREEPNLRALEEIFRHNILPLLQEYFYDDWTKIDLVLNNNGFLRTETIDLPETDLPHADARRWRIVGDAFMDPDNYRKIYRADADTA